MNPVPSYELIPFLDWLNRRGLRLSSEQNFRRLNSLAIEYLQGHLVGPITTLSQVMKIFQDCPMVGETDVASQMKHFARCGSCIEYIRDRGRASAPHERQVHVARETSDNETGLHPLLQGYVSRMAGSPLEVRLQYVRRRDHADFTERVFHQLIMDIGDDLCDSFLNYLAEVREQQPRLIEDYLQWRGSQWRQQPRARRQVSDSVEDYTQPIGSDEPIEQAASRLVNSVQLLVRGGFYDKSLAEEPQLFRLMSSLAIDTPEDLAQTLAFLGWLRRREPKLNVAGNVPVGELEKLIMQFCEEESYANVASFSKQAKRWLTGAGSHGVAERIARFLGLDRNIGLPGGRPAPDNPLDRYGAVRFHGLFLFLSSGDFPGFIESHWRDLHYMTGDNLDIYYSQSDLSERTSGYELAALLKGVRLRVDALPALLLWEDHMENSKAIPLHNLKHGEIIEVMQAVVQAIRDGCTLNAITDEGAARADELRNKQGHGVVVQSGAALFINNGGVVGDVYKNESGMVGAMGAGAIAHDNVFIQNARKSLEETKITPIDAAAIAELAGILAESTIPGLDPAERKKGADYLRSVAVESPDGQERVQSLANWKKWLTGIGQRSEAVLSVLANVATVAAPIAKLLGFSI